MMYDRSAATEPAFIDEWDGGLGWIAHPHEDGRRASHAFAFDDGVWIVDPLDAPGVDERISALGEVVGVIVGSSWHTRHADRFARAYDVPVAVPARMDRVARRIDAPVERVDGDLPATGVTVVHRRPFPGFGEAILLHEATGTLYVPESLGTTPHHLIGDERIGLQAVLRLFPPSAIRGFAPARICCGHGEGIFDDATDALATALATPRRTFPRAIAAHVGPTVRAAIAALGG